jgi:phosphoserine phosphatase RsbU/P
MQAVGQILELSTISGPQSVSLELSSPDPRTIGRLNTHSLCLDDQQVSREHASLTYRDEPNGGGRWYIQDLKSRHGTRVNGTRLQPNKPCPLRAGDYIEIRPWVFQIVDPTQPRDPSSIVHTVPDTDADSDISTMALQADAVRDLDRHRLRLILQCAESMQSATNLANLAATTLEAAIKGTGFANGAMLGPLEADGAITVIRQEGREIGGRENTGTAKLSRTLIQQASRGQTVQLMNQSGGGPLNEAVSIIQLGIQEAICVPLMIESTAAGYIYLDNRGRRGSTPVAQDAGPFVAGLARMAALALANIGRQDLERRYAHMEGEVAAAAAAQRLILPLRQGRCGAFEYIGECRAGRMVSGDFFDVFELPGNRIAVTIGDVAGKGVPASVLMTTTQGFLHGALCQHGDAARAANDLNEFVNQRSETGRFVTLWIGVFDREQSQLQYVNAGHGYAWHVHAPPQGEVVALDQRGGPPIGVDPDHTFSAETVSLGVNGAVALVSDGIIEQPGAESSHNDMHQFSRTRVESFLAKTLTSNDAVAELFDEVLAHGSATELADDATVVVVRW